MGDSNENFPYKIKDIDFEENELINDFINGLKLDYVRVGPKGYLLPKDYKNLAANIYNFPIRSNDVYVVSYPKSGTTWTQDLVWLIQNNLNYDRAKSEVLDERFPFLEATMFPIEMMLGDLIKDVPDNKLIPGTVDQIKALSSPRFIKTHLPLSLLSPTLLDTAKVVYVTRDPRDVAVSYFHHNKFMKISAQDTDFKTYWSNFMKNRTIWSPFFDHLLEAWEKRHHPNLLFLFYEELSMDLAASIRRVAEFFGRDLSDKEVADLQEHLKFDNFKKNKSVNYSGLVEKGVFRKDGAFIRNGKMGGWRDYFDEEMTKEADKWIQDNLRLTDFRFIHM